MNYPLLEKISSPEDVKALNYEEINALCEEIRNCIIETVSKNGGHLASNLGAVELTVALHRAFSSPKDAIIFDVGHQCYTHKLLTGRFKDFSTLRTKGGLSGFMKPEESIHDPVVTGHSSNSISAALGIYKAKRIKNEEGTAIAVIGDGALTGGIAYEALNNAGDCKGNFIVVLNDNEMSISKNVGSLAGSLTKMRNKPRYHNFKSSLSRFLRKIPLIGKGLNNGLFALKELAKRMVYKNNIFASLGFNYLGPVDGHDVKSLEALFKVAKNYDRPSIVHVVTIKGRGYTYAEEMPEIFHGVSPFAVDAGATANTSANFSSVAGETVLALADKDASVCAITAAMTEGTGLSDFSKKYPDRFFDVGIAEQHALTFAAGLAKAGMKPYFAVYSSFLQRGYDQIVHDIALSGLPVKLLVDRAGIVGEDGATHQGIFDVPLLTNVPNVTVFSPSTYDELKFRINYSANASGFMAIRYPRGGAEASPEFDFEKDFNYFKGNGNKLLITYGRLFFEAAKAKIDNQDINILKLNKIFPISSDALRIAQNFSEIHFFEESIKQGGIAEHFLAELMRLGFKGNFVIHAIDGKFVPHAPCKDSLAELGLLCDDMKTALF